MPIFFAELRYWLRQPIPYLFATVLFAICFAIMWGMAAEAPGGVNAEVLNSAFRLSFMTNYLSLLMLFLLPSVVGVALYRDYKSRMYALLYSYPLTKRAYLGAKFGAAMLVVFVVVSMIGLGFAAGALVPGAPPEVLAPFSGLVYAQLYGLFILPNMVLFGLLVFLVVSKTRNIYLAFIVIILFVAVQALVGGLLQTADFQNLAAILDPTGDTAVKRVMRRLTLEERNTRLIPLSGLLLVNRMLWGAVTVVLAVYTYRSFSFRQFAAARKSAPRPVALLTSDISTTPPIRPTVEVAPASRTSLSSVLRLSTHATRYITRSYAFLALLLVGLLTVGLQQAQMNPEFGFALLPTTGRMLRIPMFIFGLSINLITFLYVGVLAHRGRMTQMGDLVDVCQVSDRVLLASRLFAVLRVQLLLLFLVMLGGIATQLSQGYTRVEIWHYVLELFGLQFVHFVIWACLATFVHTFFTNLYLGFFVLLLTGSAFSALAELGTYLDWPLLRDGVVQFNSTPRVFGGFAYSDWNGYGGVLGHYWAYKGYWLLGGALCLLLALACWRRGYTFSWRERGMQGWDRLSGPLRPAVLALGVGFLSLGAGLYYHDHVLADHNVSDRIYAQTLARNERLFSTFLPVPQPRIARVEAAVDIFPETREYRAEGTLWYVNKSARPLDTIVVSTSFKDRVNYRLDFPHETLLADSVVRSAVHHLRTPLGRGDSLALHFSVRNAPNAPLWANDRILTNGTYLLGHHILPQLGVRNVFLSGEKKRATYNLPASAPRRLVVDTLGYGNPANNMDRIHYATTVSTSLDQQAFSMGKLRDSWTKGGRRYYRYVSDGPMVNNVSWLSGKYVTTRDDGGLLPIRFYNHPDHLTGVGNFRRGVQSGLVVNTELFGPLAHDTLRVVEFPLAAGSHATLNGNLIPTSEAYFLCDVDHEDNEVFNVPFFVGAHETAHYWWGHRVDPANVAGGRVITEGLADYLAIQAMARNYGAASSREMIKRWRELYFRSRAGRGNETPLSQTPLTDDMDYLNYRKAALAFHGLAGYLGADRLHAALADFEKRFRHAPPPYATIEDLIASLAAASPDSLRYLTDDYFRSITLYDNAVKTATVSQAPNGTYVVDVSCRITKYRADARGKRSYTTADNRTLRTTEAQSLPLADYLDIVSYAGEEIIDRRRLKVTAIDTEVTLLLPRQPDRIVLDPDLLLFDAELADNTITPVVQK